MNSVVGLVLDEELSQFALTPRLHPDGLVLPRAQHRGQVEYYSYRFAFAALPLA